MKDKQLAYLLLLPIILVLSAFILYPLIGTLLLSLKEALVIKPYSTFIGLTNYLDILKDTRFFNSLLFTAKFVILSVSLEIVLGVLIALLLNESFRGRGLVRAAVLIPWVIPTIVSAKMWQWILNYNIGILNFILKSLGVTKEGLNWLGNSTLAYLSIVTTDVWKTTPFVAIIVLAGLQAIPQNIIRQAKTDGAGMTKRFFHIILPIIKPVLLVAILFRVIDALRVFDIVYVLTGGGPGGATETLSIYAYKLMFGMGNFGYGSAVALSVFIIVVIFSFSYVKMQMVQITGSRPRPFGGLIK